MLAGRVMRGLSKWNSGGRGIATSAQPSREKGPTYSIEEWWILIPAGLFASAAWNLFRATSKEKVRERRESRLKMEALKGNQIHNSVDLDSVEFRKVECRGVYDEKRSILVNRFLKMKSGWESGYNLLTPLMPIPADPQSIQSPILVNRGWVPLSWRDIESNPSSSSPSSTQGTQLECVAVEFVGAISKGERPNKLWKRNNPAKSEWFTVDVASLADACGLPQTTLHVVEIDFSSKMDTKKPAPFAPLRKEVKGIYLSQLEHERYASLGFFNGCGAMAVGLKKFGKH